MGDYISREALMDFLTMLPIDLGYREIDDVKQYVKTTPAADVVEVVRCKDCKHKHLENMVWTCPFGLLGGENFFCGYGAEPYKEEQE